jgi:hypothetical protein
VGWWVKKERERPLRLAFGAREGQGWGGASVPGICDMVIMVVTWACSLGPYFWCPSSVGWWWWTLVVVYVVVAAVASKTQKLYVSSKIGEKKHT